MKVDEEIKDKNGIAYPIAIIMKVSNPYLTEVFNEFVKLAAAYNDGK